MRIPDRFDYWRPRPRRGGEDTVWAAQYATAGSALAAVFADKQVDQDEWVRLMGELKERGYPTVGDGAMWTEELAIVRAVYAALRPAVALEVGVRNGASLRAAREGWTPRRHDAVDIDPMCARFCPPGVNFILGDETIQPVVFDVATLDDGHSKGCCRRWLEALGPCALGSSVILVHDMREESVGGDDRAAVVGFLGDHAEWAGFELCTPCGLAILRRKP